MTPYIQSLLDMILQESHRIQEQNTPETYTHATNIAAAVILIEQELGEK